MGRGSGRRQCLLHLRIDRASHGQESVIINNSVINNNENKRFFSPLQRLLTIISPARPASREACCRAAVKPRPACMSPYAPARQRRAVRGQGALPLVRAMRPVAEWRSFLFNKQGKHTRPASREARCRAAVKPRPSSMSPYAPARLWRAVRKGAQPPWMSTGRSVSWKGSVSPLRS